MGNPSGQCQGRWPEVVVVLFALVGLASSPLSTRLIERVRHTPSFRKGGPPAREDAANQEVAQNDGNQRLVMQMQVAAAKLVLIEEQDRLASKYFPDALPPGILHRMALESVHQIGAATERVLAARLVDAVARNRSLKLVVLGGSVSYGWTLDQTGDIPYISVLGRLLDFLAPGSSLVVKNSAIPAAGVTAALAQVNTLVPQDTDLVITEFNINPSDHETCMNLMESLQTRASPPAVLNLNLFSCAPGCINDYTSCGPGLGAHLPPSGQVHCTGAATERNITTLSYALAISPFWLGQPQPDPGTTETCEAANCAGDRAVGGGAMDIITTKSLFNFDFHHQNGRGHELVALIVVRYIMRVFLSVTEEQADEYFKELAQTKVVAGSRAAGSLVTRWGSWQPNGASDCKSLVPTAVVPPGSWNLEKLRDDKAAYFSTTPGSTMTVHLSVSKPSRLEVGFVQSQRMGRCKLVVNGVEHIIDAQLKTQTAMTLLEIAPFPETVGPGDISLTFTLLDAEPGSTVPVKFGVVAITFNDV